MTGWNWRSGEGGPGDGVDGGVGEVLAQGFPTQSEAEAWLTESWPTLLDDGVAAVSLYEEGRLVYGPMPLTAED